MNGLKVTYKLNINIWIVITAMTCDCGSFQKMINSNPKTNFLPNRIIGNRLLTILL